MKATLDPPIDYSGIVVSGKHSTPHARRYTGSLSKLIDHAKREDTGSWTYTPAHDYVVESRLRRFLLAEGLISQDEFQFDGGTNGSKYWIFFPDIEKHRKIVKESESRGLNTVFTGVPHEPVRWTDDECGLTTDAILIVCDREGHYDTEVPEKLRGSDGEKVFLQVTKNIQLRAGALTRYTRGMFRQHDSQKAVAPFLADLRQRFHGEGGKICLYAAVGADSSFGSERCQLRISDNETYRWAQNNLLPALKKVFNSQEAQDAIRAREDINSVRLLQSGNVERKEIRAAQEAVAEAEAELKQELEENAYKPAFEAAAEKLGKNRQVIDVLKAI
ncbi:MAG: hypothetical protein HY512_03280 [Candidatus Aenigmarchaeota archaeon]|nr:hypothetical protein [Candidatus Aenigmarchaeota archaeon]